jgi:hypothetical protein
LLHLNETDGHYHHHHHHHQSIDLSDFIPLSCLFEKLAERSGVAVTIPILEVPSLILYGMGWDGMVHTRVFPIIPPYRRRSTTVVLSIIQRNYMTDETKRLACFLL